MFVGGAAGKYSGGSKTGKQILMQAIPVSRVGGEGGGYREEGRLMHPLRFQPL